MLPTSVLNLILLLVEPSSSAIPYPFPIIISSNKPELRHSSDSLKEQLKGTDRNIASWITSWLMTYMVIGQIVPNPLMWLEQQHFFPNKELFQNIIGVSNQNICRKVITIS
jgi:hypothetical protein